MFAEQGFHHTSVRMIAVSAQVNLAGVSYHFGGKEALYREILVRALERMIGDDRDGRVSEQEVVCRLARALLQPLVAPAKDQAVARLIAWEVLEPTGVFAQLAQNRIDPAQDELVKIVRYLTASEAAGAALA